MNNKCKLCNREFKDYQDMGRSRCGGCNTKIRRYRAKIAAIKHLGGKCKTCGWSGNIAAFQFHHRDNNKEFEIGVIANKKWEIIKEELKKCDLLCANCHHIYHANNTDEKFLEEVKNYNGRNLDW